MTGFVRSGSERVDGMRAIDFDNKIQHAGVHGAS
jgi:hypothetical protein